MRISARVDRHNAINPIRPIRPEQHLPENCVFDLLAVGSVRLTKSLVDALGHRKVDVLRLRPQTGRKEPELRFQFEADSLDRDWSPTDVDCGDADVPHPDIAGRLGIISCVRVLPRDRKPELRPIVPPLAKVQGQAYQQTDPSQDIYRLFHARNLPAVCASCVRSAHRVERFSAWSLSGSRAGRMTDSTCDFAVWSVTVGRNAIRPRRKSFMI